MPTPTLVCFGISAPALLLKGVLLLLPLTWRLGSVLGFSAGEIAFLAGTIILWYFVGRATEGPRSSAPMPRITGEVLLVNLSVAGTGILLFFMGVIAVRSHQGNNLAGSIVEGALFISWALTLIVHSAIRIARHLRREHIKPSAVA
jgi:hypothetical protein